MSFFVASLIMRCSTVTFDQKCLSLDFFKDELNQNGTKLCDFCAIGYVNTKIGHDWKWQNGCKEKKNSLWSKMTMENNGKYENTENFRGTICKSATMLEKKWTAMNL